MMLFYSLFHLSKESPAADYRRPADHDIRVDRRPLKSRRDGRR